MNTILITGVAGFIGSNLARKLLIEGNHIIGIDDMNSYYDVELKEYRLRELRNICGDNAELTFIQGDISDKDIVIELFRKYKPSIIVNLAAQAGVRYSIDNPDVYIKSNIVGFYNILEACRWNLQHGFEVSHLVYASSSSVYGNNNNIPFSEDDVVDAPVSLYAATKKSNELLAHSYAKLYNIPCTGVRFFTVYGPAGRPDMAYYSFAKKIVNGEKIKIFNYGNAKRDFTYIDDVIEGLALILQRPPEKTEGEDGLPNPPYDIFNIGNSSPESLIDFVTILFDKLKEEKLVNEKDRIDDYVELVSMQPGDVEVTYADMSKMLNTFGYLTSTNLKDGLSRFVKWFASYYNV